jgi:hypothetical protein
MIRQNSEDDRGPATLGIAENFCPDRSRHQPEFEMADLFMDFKGIQVTLAKMAQALIDGRIDCKTAGRLVVQLQMASKLLWAYHRGHRGTQREKKLTTKETRSTPLSQAQGRSGQAKEHKGLPQVCADERGLNRSKASTTKDTKGHEEQKQVICGPNHLPARHLSARHLSARHLSANQGEKPRIGLIAELLAFADIRGLAHGPPDWARAA